MTACLVVLAFAQPAPAHRAPTKGERQGIRKAVVRACEALDQGINCWGVQRARVSTADPRYAIGEPRGTGGFPARFRAGLKRSDGRWQVLWEEVNDLNILTCADYRRHFPEAVIADFEIIGFPGQWGAAPPVPCWKREAARLAPERIVIGGVVYAAPTGAGWGSERPRRLYNGGVPSGLIRQIEWTSWGGAEARGHGLHSIYKPSGGYYRHPVVIQLRAKQVGECEGRSAYLRLLVREPRRPGGPVGAWHSWAGRQTLCEPYGSSFRR
jgi:hypothetical protein